MMKKLLAILSALMLLFTATAFAEGTEPTEGMIFKLSGIVMDVTEDGDLLINTSECGDVIVHKNEDTKINGVEKFEVGQYVYIDFNGVMAMSLPGQINADVISSYYLKGEVVAVAGNNIQLKTENQEYCVVIDGDIEVFFEIGETMDLYGEMTELEFAGLPVVTTSFVGTVAPNNARD